MSFCVFFWQPRKKVQQVQQLSNIQSSRNNLHIMTITWPFRITFLKLIFNYEIALSPIESAHNLRKLKVKMRSFLHVASWRMILLPFVFRFCKSLCEKLDSSLFELLAYEEKKGKSFLSRVFLMMFLFCCCFDCLHSTRHSFFFIVCLWFYLFDYFPFKTELKKYAFGTGLQHCQSEGKQL